MCVGALWGLAMGTVSLRAELDGVLVLLVWRSVGRASEYNEVSVGRWDQREAFD